MRRTVGIFAAGLIVLLASSLAGGLVFLLQGAAVPALRGGPAPVSENEA